MLEHFNLLIAYIKTPSCGRDENYTTTQKIKIVFQTLVLSLIVAFCLSMLFAVIESFGLINMDNHASAELFKEFSPIMVFFLAVILAPVLEELIFRAPITLFCSKTKLFKYVFYGFAIAFGYVHLFNFEITNNVILLSPIMVAPQIILGLFLGYIRVKLGLIYSILLHGLYNGILITPVLLFPDLIGL